jgi:hypothetical protein
MPTIADAVITMSRLRDRENDIRARGAIFCHVRRTIAWVHSVNSMTWGNQK